MMFCLIIKEEERKRQDQRKAGLEKFNLNEQMKKMNRKRILKLMTLER